MEQFHYHITVTVRDENGKILQTSKEETERKISTIQETDIKFELSVRDDGQLESKMRGIARTMKSWLPKDYQINLEASVYMNVSGDGYYMNMFSFYGSEDRFVTH